MCPDCTEYRTNIDHCLCWQVKSSRNLKYKDFFDAVDGEPAKADEQSGGEDDSIDEEGEEDKDDEADDSDGEEEGDDE